MREHYAPPPRQPGFLVSLALKVAVLAIFAFIGIILSIRF